MWYDDPCCDPIDIRRRAWRYCKHDLRWFRSMMAIADVIEGLRKEVRGLGNFGHKIVNGIVCGERESPKTSPCPHPNDSK